MKPINKHAGNMEGTTVVHMEGFESMEDYWKLMEFTVANSWAGCIIANKEGQYIYTNKIYEQITGLPPHEMVGSSVASAHGAAILSKHSSTTLVLKEKKEILTEQELRDDHQILVRGTPYFNEKGEVKYVLSQLFNVERLNRLQMEASKNSRKGWEHFDKVEIEANEVGAGSVDYIIYKSETMCKAIEQARLVADSDATVLILGESGTGKELMAKFIHQASRRKEEPFIHINCSAIPANLLESEFFGYEAGSFTGGSSKGKKGLLEYGNNGTVLLDEIGDMPYHMQAKILHVLQTKEFTRIGGNRPIKLNVRFIASTNAHLLDLIKEKSFRADLYYRLNTASIRIPPLRDRKEDIPLLIEYFLREFNQIYHTHKRTNKSLTEKLTSLPLPGNVRELRNIIERLIIMSRAHELGADDLLDIHLDQYEELEREPAGGRCGSEYVLDFEGKSFAEIMENYEKHVLTYFKERYKKKADMAAALKVYPSTITRKMQQYGL